MNRVPCRIQIVSFILFELYVERVYSIHKWTFFHEKPQHNGVLMLMQLFLKGVIFILVLLAVVDQANTEVMARSNFKYDLKCFLFIQWFFMKNKYFRIKCLTPQLVVFFTVILWKLLFVSKCSVKICKIKLICVHILRHVYEVYRSYYLCSTSLSTVTIIMN